MTTIEKLRTLAHELAGEAWDYDRRYLPAQAYVRREAAKAVMKQADSIQREDAIFEDSPAESTGTTPVGDQPEVVPGITGIVFVGDSSTLEQVHARLQWKAREWSPDARRHRRPARRTGRPRPTRRSR